MCTSIGLDSSPALSLQPSVSLSLSLTLSCDDLFRATLASSWPLPTTQVWKCGTLNRRLSIRRWLYSNLRAFMSGGAWDAWDRSFVVFQNFHAANCSFVCPWSLLSLVLSTSAAAVGSASSVCCCTAEPDILLYVKYTSSTWLV